MANHITHSGWLRTLNRAEKDRVNEIWRPSKSEWHGGRDLIGQWWIRLTPTLPPHREITLLYKVDGVTVREWPISRNGQLVTNDQNGQ